MARPSVCFVGCSVASLRATAQPRAAPREEPTPMTSTNDQRTQITITATADAFDLTLSTPSGRARGEERYEANGFDHVHIAWAIRHYGELGQETTDAIVPAVMAALRAGVRSLSFEI